MRESHKRIFSSSPELYTSTHMRTTFVRASAFVLLMVLLGTSVPVESAEAQSRRDWSQWRSQFQRSSEGNIDEEVEERATNRRGVSSSVQRKINQLDDDPVDDLSIPILLGVALNQLTRNYGDPRDGGSRSHEGLDILAPRGAYVVSPTEAVVIRTGTGSSAGKYVYTANPGGETFVYMHLDDIADGLRSGDELEKGDLIGYVGDTGNAVGGVTHLHFEIREGRSSSDPYPRLTEVFTLKERMEALDGILQDSDDEEDEAEALVASYRGLFVAAAAQDIDVPEAVEEVLAAAGVVVDAPATGFTRDLDVGSSGQDVVALQAFLIAENEGAQARALAAAGATGYFGTITKAALAEYQAANGISPAAGYFGPLTRAFVATAATR